MKRLQDSAVACELNITHTHHITSHLSPHIHKLTNSQLDSFRLLSFPHFALLPPSLFLPSLALFFFLLCSDSSPLPLFLFSAKLTQKKGPLSPLVSLYFRHFLHPHPLSASLAPAPSSSIPLPSIPSFPFVTSIPHFHYRAETSHGQCFKCRP